MHKFQFALSAEPNPARRISKDVSITPYVKIHSTLEDHTSVPRILSIPCLWTSRARREQRTNSSSTLVGPKSCHSFVWANKFWILGPALYSRCETAPYKSRTPTGNRQLTFYFLECRRCGLSLNDSVSVQESAHRLLCRFDLRMWVRCLQTLSWCWLISSSMCLFRLLLRLRIIMKDVL